jgi:hypothetical protein
MDATMWYCVGISVFAGIFLYLYHFHVDPYKDIERYYFKNDKLQHGLFKLAYYIVFISFVLCVRYMVFEGFNTAITQRH